MFSQCFFRFIGNVPLHEWTETEREPLIDIVTWVFEEGTFIPAARITDKGCESIINDYLGTPNAMYDSEGNKTWEADLDIYGRVRTFAGRSLNECPFRFQGQYFDEETGLAYNRFRYYDPDSGNYISQDPIGLAGNNSTLYAYVHDTNGWIDVLGLAAANGGMASQHGGNGHNRAIDDEIARLQKDPTVSNIRKNQQQVDINGNTVGTNRPDVQYDRGGVHHNVEYDTTAIGSTRHQNQIPRNDPNSRNTFWYIDNQGNSITGHSQLPQQQSGRNPGNRQSSNKNTRNRTKGDH